MWVLRTTYLLPLLAPPLHATLLWGDQSKSHQIRIDLRADMSLMDVTLASELSIPTQPRSFPMNVRALYGRSIGQVTHHTTPINLQVSGNHSEMIKFLLIESPQVPVVLGFSWLQRHNPPIDWSTGAIVGWSPFCHTHCLKSPLPASDDLEPSLDIVHQLLFTNMHRPPLRVLPEAAVLSCR